MQKRRELREQCGRTDDEDEGEKSESKNLIEELMHIANVLLPYYQNALIDTAELRLKTLKEKIKK